MPKLSTLALICLLAFAACAREKVSRVSAGLDGDGTNNAAGGGDDTRGGAILEFLYGLASGNVRPPMSSFQNVFVDYGYPTTGAKGTIDIPGGFIFSKRHKITLVPDLGRTSGAFHVRVTLKTPAGDIILPCQGTNCFKINASPSGSTSSVPTTYDLPESLFAAQSSQGAVQSGLKLSFETTAYTGTGASYVACAAFCVGVYEDGHPLPASSCDFSVAPGCYQ